MNGLALVGNCIKSIERKQFKKQALICLAIDVYNDKIDGLDTRMVAEKYGVSMNLALKSLQQIVHGEIYHDELYPFGEYSEDMCGVEIATGRTFTYGDNADYMEGRKGTNHYNWFGH